MIALDHLVVAARTLEEGARWLEERVGAACERGGAHAGFGTHNALLRVAPDVYVEVLAADPRQPAPPRPRLFGLDEPATQARLARGPFLLHWVVRTGDLAGAIAALAAAAGVPAEAVGTPTPMRRGALAWQLTVRDDGALPPAGLPSVIEWGETRHPCTRLRDAGVVLAQLEVPVAAGGLEGDPRIVAPGARLAATLEGTRGAVRIE